MRELTPQQISFVEQYINTNDIAGSVLASGYKSKYPSQLGYELMNKPHIKAELERRQQIVDDEIRKQFKKGALKAYQALMNILEDTEANPQARVASAKDILDRAGFKAAAKADINQEVNYSHEEAELERLFLETRNTLHERRRISDVVATIDTSTKENLN
ncbi:hypothetical protein COJ46_02530 [Bacillus sp. AFS077874]|uniref:terminase small subunit n=1 Tax=Bacillus sp. AFS077874 TaxID=2033513 RepID=UPI000BF79443|nr:terminase small subunit [Bacillus sp. AFS077874]PFM82703.1 hypothetical protein COJ46_02530 [Bacillus sp. AFS077874]